MSALATYALGVGLLVGIAAGWLGVQRLWLRSSGQAGVGRDALTERFSCGGDGECGACEGECETECERARPDSGRQAGRGSVR